jgi:hypothetical protein
VRSLSIAYGSTCELETQLLLSGDLGYPDKESLSGPQRDIGEVERMTKALIKSLENKQAVAEIPFRSSKPFLINLGLTPGDFKTRPSGFKQLKSLIFRFAKIYYQKRFNDHSKRFSLGNSPQTLDPLTPGILEPFLPTNWEKSQDNRQFSNMRFAIVMHFELCVF